MLEFEQANPLPISLYFYCRKPCTLIAEFFVLELPKILYFTLPFTVSAGIRNFTENVQRSHDDRN